MAEVNLLSSSNELQKWKQRSQRSCDVEKWKRRSLNAAGRARSQRKNHPPDTQKCLPFAVAPDGWSASDSAAGLKALGHFASEVCNKHMGYGYEELYQW